MSPTQNIVAYFRMCSGTQQLEKLRAQARKEVMDVLVCTADCLVQEPQIQAHFQPWHGVLRI